VSALPEAVRWWGAAWSFALGAAVGSFLNVVVARVPAGESIVRPGSRCPRCRTPLAWYDNLPLLSWLLLRARCRHCGAPISWRYPLVELLGAVAAVAAFARHGFAVSALAELALAAALIALSFIDLDTWLLPHAITWPLLAAGLLLSAAGVTPAGAATPSLLGAGIGWVAFALLSVVGARVLRREALGFGDVWLLAAVGAWLGALALLPVVLLASMQGTVVGLALILLGRAEPGPQAPPGEPVTADAGGRGGIGTDRPEDAGAGGLADGTAVRAPEAAADGSDADGPPPPEASGDPEPTDGDEDWVPPRHAVPFGPFLAAGALEWLWLGDWLAGLVPALRIFR
jgi:leader peptidase (prepilin peptidase)/N-methyltransferase